MKDIKDLKVLIDSATLNKRIREVAALINLKYTTCLFFLHTKIYCQNLI